MISYAAWSVIVGSVVVVLTSARIQSPGPATQSSCDRAARVWCFRDTAEATDGPTPDVTSTWVVYVRGSDSVEVALLPGVAGGAISTNVGQDKVEGVTAPFFHRRIAESGTLVARVSLDDNFGPRIPYTIRVRQVDTSGRPVSQLSGGRANISLVVRRPPAGRRLMAVSLIPLSSVRPGIDRRKWAFPLGVNYRVALSKDSLFELCVLPCSRPDTIKLKDGSSIAKKY